MRLRDFPVKVKKSLFFKKRKKDLRIGKCLWLFTDFVKNFVDLFTFGIALAILNINILMIHLTLGYT